MNADEKIVKKLNESIGEHQWRRMKKRRELQTIENKEVVVTNEYVCGRRLLQQQQPRGASAGGVGWSSIVMRFLWTTPSSTAVMINIL